MITEIITFIFALLGLIFTLWLMSFRITAWRMDTLTITLPLYDDSREIFDRVYCVYSLCDFCGIKKKCTIALVNYGASLEFCNVINDFYKNYDSIKIIEPKNLITELHT